MTPDLPAPEFIACGRCSKDCAAPLLTDLAVKTSSHGSLVFLGAPNTAYLACNLKVDLCPSCAVAIWTECRSKLTFYFIEPFKDARQKPLLQKLRLFYELSELEMGEITTRSKSDVRLMIDILKDVFFYLGSAEDVQKWLHQPMQDLGDVTPCGAILDGKAQQVMDLIESFKNGSYG